MTLQAREKLQEEDVEDGVLPLSRHRRRKGQPSHFGARRPRNFFPLPRLLFFYKEFSGFLQTEQIPNPKYLDRNSGRQNTS
jgi:hypothetical protein